MADTDANAGTYAPGGRNDPNARQPRAVAADRGPERIATGIAGLDAMLNGGIPKRNQVLIAGGPGSGKTLFCFEVLYHMADAGNKSLFVIFEERPDDLIRDAKNAFVDNLARVNELIDNKTLTVVREDLVLDTKNVDELLMSFAKLVTDIENLVKQTGATAVVLDSISLLKLLASEQGSFAYRRAILSLMNSLRRLDVTALLTIELASTERKDMKYTPEFFVFDGIIMMYQSESEGKRLFNLEIMKMRGTNHSVSFSPYEITKKGFRVFTTSEASTFE